MDTVVHVTLFYFLNIMYQLQRFYSIATLHKTPLPCCGVVLLSCYSFALEPSQRGVMSREIVTYYYHPRKKEVISNTIYQMTVPII